MFTLIKLNQMFHRKDICTGLNIRGAFQPSVAQRAYAALHPSEETDFIIIISDKEFHVKSNRDSELMHKVFRNLPVCNRDLCRVTCSKCSSGHCMHEFVCTCEWFSFRNMCKHLHVVSSCIYQERPESFPAHENLDTNQGHSNPCGSKSDEPDGQHSIPEELAPMDGTVRRINILFLTGLFSSK